MPLFCCPLFFKEYLNHLDRINKMSNEQVNFHTSHSGLTSRIHPLIFLFQICWIFFQALSPTGWGNFQTDCVSIIRKCIYSSCICISTFLSSPPAAFCKISKVFPTKKHAKKKLQLIKVNLPFSIWEVQVTLSMMLTQHLLMTNFPSYWIHQSVQR